MRDWPKPKRVDMVEGRAELGLEGGVRVPSRGLDSDEVCSDGGPEVVYK